MSAPGSDDALRAGRQIAGRYRLLEQVGAGGMGAVLRARDLEADREVAIKLLTAADLSGERLERFRREGELAAQLRHPGIVAVHAAGVAEDGRPYLVYELVGAARTLDVVLPTLERREQVELVRQVAEALGAAHAAGIVHRDVKPENVLVDDAGRARVTDFGAALQGEQARLTLTGAIVGTPAYMAPEQLKGERDAICPATDVWALGVILYEAVGGAPPFPADSLPELFTRVERGVYTPLAELEPGVDPELEAVIGRCLRTAPGERLTDGAAAAQALRGVLDPSTRSGSALHPSARRSPTRWLVTLIVALVGVAGALGAVHGLVVQPRAEAARAQAEVEAWRERALAGWDWGLGAGDPAPGPDRAAVAAQRARLEAAAAALGAEPPALAAELAAVERLLAHRAGEPSEVPARVADRGADALVVDAAVWAERPSQRRAALQRVGRALELEPAHLPGQLLQLRLEAELAPAGFLARCAASGLPAPVRALAAAKLPRVVAGAARRYLKTPADARSAQLAAQRRAWDALGLAADAWRTAVASGLEEAASDWARALRAARPDDQLELLRSLAPLLDGAGDPGLGPRLRAGLEATFKAPLQDFLGDTRRVEVGLHALAVDEVLTYALRLPQRGEPTYAKLLRSLRTAPTRERSAFVRRFLLAALRCGMPIWGSNLIRTVPTKERERVLREYPESQAARFAQAVGHRLERRDDELGHDYEPKERAILDQAVVNRIFAGRLADLATVYRGEVHYWRAYALRNDPSQRAQLLAAIRAARPLIAAGDERLRQGLGYYQRTPWLVDLMNWEAAAEKHVGDSAAAARAYAVSIELFVRRLARLGRGGRRYAQDRVILARARAKAARAHAAAGDRAAARRCAEQALQVLKADGQATGELEALLERLGPR